MFVDVETFFFYALADTQAVCLLDAVEQGESAGGSPEVYDQYAEALSTEESPAVTVERTVRSREQTSHQRSEDTADTVYGTGTHRIVDVQYMIDKLDGVDQYDTTHETDDHSTYGRDVSESEGLPYLI